MSHLSATFHAPDRADQTLRLPPSESGGWSVAMVGGEGQGAFHGVGSPKASALFDALVRRTSTAACSVALIGPKAQTIQRRHNGTELAFAAQGAASGPIFEAILEVLDPDTDPMAALATLMRSMGQTAPDWVLCNGQESFVHSRGGLFMTGRIGLWDTGAHPSVHVSAVPFGEFVWERLPDGCLVHFVGGCEAGRLDTGTRLDPAECQARQTTLLRRTERTAARLDEAKRIAQSSWWSG